MPDEFAARLVAFAERTMRIRAHCAGEDAARIYLVMPFLELLGYDAGDPSVIIPDHDNAINFAVMVDGQSAVAVEVTGAARPAAQAYDRLRAYCDAVGTLKLGIATNGVQFDVFIDSGQRNVLDPEPFLRVDLARIASGDLEQQTIDLLTMMCATTYDPEGIAEQAFALGLRERLKACLLDEFRSPSEAFCRHLLELAGIRNVKAGIIDQHYRPILKTALEQAIIVPVLQALRLLPSPPQAASPEQPEPAGAKIEPLTPSRPLPRNRPQPRDPATETMADELVAFDRVKRRSA